MLKWLFILPGIVVTWWLISTIREISRFNRRLAERRNKIKCPICGCGIGSMFEESDKIAFQKIQEVIANAPYEQRVFPAGHPVEQHCKECNGLLSFNDDDEVTIA